MRSLPEAMTVSLYQPSSPKLDYSSFAATHHHTETRPSTMPRRSPRLKARTKCTITERLRPFAALFRGPRRDEEKIAQVWRREIFGIPTRWDRWLDRELARGLELDAAAPRPGNVKCVLTVTFEEVRSTSTHA